LRHGVEYRFLTTLAFHVYVKRIIKVLRWWTCWCLYDAQVCWSLLQLALSSALSSAASFFLPYLSSAKGVADVYLVIIVLTRVICLRKIVTSARASRKLNCVKCL